jgi:hypothetical protein
MTADLNLIEIRPTKYCRDLIVAAVSDAGRKPIPFFVGGHRPPLQLKTAIRREAPRPSFEREGLYRRVDQRKRAARRRFHIDSLHDNFLTGTTVEIIAHATGRRIIGPRQKRAA